MMPHSITGLDAITGQPISITVENGCIQSISPGPANETAWLAAGFIDLQINGYGGYDLNAEDVNADVVTALVDRVIATGVTTFLPTIITAPEQQIVAALRAIAEARKASARAAHAIPFVHIEGPFLCPEDGARGAHPRESVRPLSFAEFNRWQTASGGLVGLITISPHWESALAFITATTAKGIHIAIGHTHATPEQIHAAATAGATLSTHLGNGIAAVLPRHPNPMWSQLADDRLTATFIADGHHLPADTLTAMLRAKSIARSILVSDVTAIGGMLPGIYKTSIGGEVNLSADGSLRTVGSHLLAGAALPLKDGIANCVSSGICSLAEAVRMSTENPGRLVGGRGVLCPGASADIVRFSLDTQQKRINIEDMWIKGVRQHPSIPLVYER